ncbi:MAG: hypothetical protein C4527_19355 [Candidatus Omnitrophota bacterium]|jgi:hypothetical protein|nr:MAG: hypothetical protein C4527_19355 [Candidatus Omnitrophota bacterium]
MVIHNSKPFSSNSEDSPQLFYPIEEILGEPNADENDPEAQVRELADRAIRMLGPTTNDELTTPEEWARVLVAFAYSESDLHWAFSRIKSMGLDVQDYLQYIPDHLQK